MDVEEYRLGQKEGLHVSSRGFLQGPGVHSVSPVNIGGRMVLLKDLPQMEKHVCLSHEDLEHRCGIPDFPYQPQAAGETSVCRCLLPSLPARVSLGSMFQVHTKKHILPPLLGTLSLVHKTVKH